MYLTEKFSRLSLKMTYSNILITSKLGKTGKYWQMPIDKISEKAIKTFILAKGKLGTDIS